MNNNLDIKQNTKFKTKAITLISKAIAKIILKFHLPRNEILRSIDEQLILEAKKADPDANILAIAIRTGIDRRYVSMHIKGQISHVKPNKLSLILSDLCWTAEKFYNSKTIPKRGPFRTFQSICEERAYGTLTYRAVLKELVALGNLKDLGDKVEIINSNLIFSKNEKQYSELTALQINRTVDTVLYNFDQVDKEKKYIQKTVYTTQVNPKNFPQLHNEIKQIIDSNYDEIIELIIKYEDDVEVGTYQQYGISFLEFKLEE